MNLPTRDALESLFKQAPASFIFQHSAPQNPPRSMGGRDGAALEIDGPPEAPERISLAVVLPNDNETMARRGGILLVLLLTAVERDWDAGHEWVLQQLHIAATDPRLVRNVRQSHNGLLYQLATNKVKSLATLTITKVE